MPLLPIPVVIRRPGGTVTPTLGVARSEADLPGSPFTARFYRAAQMAVARDEDAPGTATVDTPRRLSLADPAAPVRTGDIALVPSDDDPAATVRAKILRVRRYADRVQCDLETGAE